MGAASRHSFRQISNGVIVVTAALSGLKQ